MKEPKHTPGPWYVRLNDTNGHPAVIRGSEGGFVVMGLRRQREEADACLIAAAPEMFECLEEARRAIGDHNVPTDCYATGPVTGDRYRDLIECPACSFISMYDAVKKRIATGQRQPRVMPLDAPPPAARTI